MVQSAYKVSVPGSTMLLGEHAVLHGQPALVCAVNSRMTLAFEPVQNGQIKITSALGTYRAALDHLHEDEVFRFCIPLLQARASGLQGLNVDIQAEFESTVGLGSSAAVVVGFCAGIRSMTGESCEQEKILRESIEVIRAVQGSGSGADAAASVYGGVVRYMAADMIAQKLSHEPPVVLAYSGAKRPTPEVIQYVQNRRKLMAGLYKRLEELIGASVEEAKEAIERADWQQLGHLVDFNQGLMDAMGLTSEGLQKRINELRGNPGILGAKISGSGLGDCAIGIGECEAHDMVQGLIPVSVSKQGVQIETF